MFCNKRIIEIKNCFTKNEFVSTYNNMNRSSGQMFAMVQSGLELMQQLEQVLVSAAEPERLRASACRVQLDEQRGLGGVPGVGVGPHDAQLPPGSGQVRDFRGSVRPHASTHALRANPHRCHCGCGYVARMYEYAVYAGALIDRRSFGASAVL